MKYPAMDACESTMTRRYAVDCDCPTYEGNGGVCLTFEAGGNGRCVYCDHTAQCHRMFVVNWNWEQATK